MLKNKIVFITGATSGIGKACAKYFAEKNARLLLCARRFDLLNDYADELRRAYHVDVHTFQLDVRQSDSVKKTIAALPDTWKDIDVLINNAGLAIGRDPLHSSDIQGWEKMIDTNIKGLLYVTREVLPFMVARNSGHVINIGSIAGHEAYPGGNVYCATKAAVAMLSKTLRLDLYGTKIRVSTVDPGAVNTNFGLVRFNNDQERADAVYKGMTPLTADDIADAVLYCATRPAHINISEVIIMPTDQASANMVFRQS